jgi:ornithine carbamoyltransferase
VSVACPAGYEPAPEVLAFAKASGGDFTLTNDPPEAAQGADAVFTDVWASMGMEKDTEERREAFAGYQVDEGLMKLAKPDAIVQHCLPAHRGEEITADVFEAHAAEIFEEAENRLHAQKAVMVKLMA